MTMIKSPYFLFSGCRGQITALLILYLLLLPPTSCFNQHQRHPTSPAGLAFEEKARLGSTPPSCHNKCNSCHPCLAVQVPSLPSQKPPSQPGVTKTTSTLDSFDPYPAAANRYSNYKPLGWKCRCGDHFYNP